MRPFLFLVTLAYSGLHLIDRKMKDEESVTRKSEMVEVNLLDESATIQTILANNIAC